MNSRLAGIVALVGASILWGTTGSAATLAPNAGPLAIGSAALGIGGLLQAAIAVPALRASAALLRANRGTVVVGALALFIYPLAFYSSMYFAGVAVGSVVSLATAPLFSGLLEWVVDRKPLGKWWVLAALLGITGAALLATSDLQGGGTDTDPSGGGSSVPLGIAVGLVAAATYATYSWAARRLMERGVSRGAAMGAVFGWGGALLIPVLLVTGSPLVASGQAFAVAAYMALVPMFLGYILFGYGLARVPASTATTITLIEPGVAALLAVWFVGERLTVVGWVGVALFVAVLAIVVTAPAPSKQSGVADE